LPSAYTVRRPVVNAYLVRERDRRRLRELVLVVAAVAPLGLGLAGYTWLQLETLRVAYRIESLERESHRLAQTERQLRLEAAYLASPERLAERAREELGLAEPEVEQVIFVEELGR
jgi:cell division protein FtsL